MSQIPESAVLEFTINKETRTGLELSLLTEVGNEGEATVKWPPSEHNPNGRNWQHVALELCKQGSCPGVLDLVSRLTPEQEAGLSLTDDRTVLTVRVSGLNNATLMTKVGRLQNGLCEPDNTEPIRADGRTLFSIQQHKFGVSQERYFFVITGALDPATRRVNLVIDEVRLVRRSDSRRSVRVYLRERFSVVKGTPGEIVRMVATVEKLKSFEPIITSALGEFAQQVVTARGLATIAEVSASK